MLAQMGVALALEPDAPLSQSQRDLKELQVARMALVKDKTQPQEPPADPDTGLYAEAGQGPIDPDLAPVERYRSRDQRLHRARRGNRAQASDPDFDPWHRRCHCRNHPDLDAPKSAT